MTTDEDDLRLPPGLQHLLPWVNAFGIEDDGHPAEAVDAADLDQLRDLADAIQRTNEEALFGWLAGPESHSHSPSVEYVRDSALVMVCELARFRLTHRRNRRPLVPRSEQRLGPSS